MSEHHTSRVIDDPKHFDPRSGNLLERLVFNNRLLLVVICTLITAFFAMQMSGLVVNASFDKMLPQSHPYIKNYLDNRAELRGLGDSVRIVVENPRGDVFDPEFIETFSKINDEILVLPGVDRAWMKSIITPVVRWIEATEEGFQGGPVLPNDYDGSARSIEDLRINVGRAGVAGTLVSNDYRSAMIVVPLLPTDAVGQAVDYHKLSTALEGIRNKYAAGEDATKPGVKMYIIGFSKLSGDLIDGLEKVMAFFLVATVMAGAIIYSFTRCLRSTLTVLGCSLIGVVWQLGLVVFLGYGLDPFSILVPFLIFAIGISHGAQKMNGVMQDIGRGIPRLQAARYTFRRLFIPGLTALLSDAVGFGVLMLIDIPVIRELALTASIGVAILVITNLILLPLVLSYIGVNPVAAQRSLKHEQAGADNEGFGKVWALLYRLTERRWASVAIAVAVVLGGLGYLHGKGLQVGDLDAGAPELRADSRYNLDNAFITSNFGISSDVFAVMVKTPAEQCSTFETLVEIDRLGWRLAQVPGVQQTASLADTVRTYIAGSLEGNPKWMTVSDNQGLIDAQIGNAVSWNSEFLNNQCSLTPVLAYLSDHKAATLDSVVKVAAEFAAANSTEEREFLLAAGSAGIEAVTNIEVREANSVMLMYVYGAVILVCFATFRSWRAVVVAILPLMLTSILAEALMVELGIGIKVATLPVVALGVGIGVDYAIYLLSVQLAQQRAGLNLADSYRCAVAFSGKVVALIGVTLAAGVVTWFWSPIKFQADMGILLTFMFLCNMIGALILVPALSCFLLNDRHFRRIPDLLEPPADRAQTTVRQSRVDVGTSRSATDASAAGGTPLVAREVH